VEEDEGKPTAAPGLEGIDPNKEILRLEQMILSGIDPRIPGVHTKGIPGFQAGPVIVMRIPKSWTAPHMVVFKKLSRFYSRNSAGKYQLDVGEIRAAFAMSEEIPRRIRQFRDERVARIIADEGPLPLLPKPKIILHVVPMMAADSTTRYDMAVLRDAASQVGFFDEDSRFRLRLNLDGVLKYQLYDNQCEAYMQFYRSGAVEAVGADLIEIYNPGLGGPGFHGCDMAEVMIHAFSQLLEFLRKCDISPPVFVFVTLTGVRGSTLLDRPSPVLRACARDYSFDRDPLLVPEIVVEDLSGNPDRILRPVFDMVWQAAGYPQCQNYDEHGDWRKAR